MLKEESEDLTDKGGEVFSGEGRGFDMDWTLEDFSSQELRVTKRVGYEEMAVAPKCLGSISGSFDRS